MTTKFQEFKDLHYTETPLLLGNVWNVQSAKVLEKLGYKALGTSSYAVAETLGYKDGENISFKEYLFVVERIAKSTDLPLSVDLEFGFGETAKTVVANIVKLYDLGVVGINIEDSVVHNAERTLINAAVFTKKLAYITNTLAAKNIELFINVRCDAFLLNVPNKLEEAITRVKHYETTPIHGIFLPCIIDPNDIKEVVVNIKSPLNVLGLPNFPNSKTLQQAGVKRISIGNFVNDFIYKQMENVCLQVAAKGDFSPLFNN
jgi:2-methylisocitrate lyase-like PEP mutase family enzyme